MVQVKTAASLVLSLSSTALAACNYGTSSFPREPNVPVGKFGYTGLDGPLNWYGLNTSANELCATGRHQSPIDINSSIDTVHGSYLDLCVDSYPKGAEFENLGTTLEVPVNGTLRAGNKAYKLQQFHFHTPSEHRIDLEYFPMEVHFVSEATDTSLAVVSFVVAFGPADPLLTSVFTYLNGASKPGRATLTGPLDFENLQHHLHSQDIYSYSGSLTTPPCSEGVQWFISRKPIHIDVGTYDSVKSVLKFNSRYTQNTLGGANLVENEAKLVK